MAIPNPAEVLTFLKEVEQSAALSTQEKHILLSEFSTNTSWTGMGTIWPASIPLLRDLIERTLARYATPTALPDPAGEAGPEGTLPHTEADHHDDPANVPGPPSSRHLTGAAGATEAGPAEVEGRQPRQTPDPKGGSKRLGGKVPSSKTR